MKTIKMNSTIKLIAIIWLLSFGCTAIAQESTLPEDFHLPKNTVKAFISYADFEIPKQHFAIRPQHYTYTFQNGKIINNHQSDSAKNWKADINYHYENGQLRSKETITSSEAGMEYKTYKYRTETKDYKTTYFKTYHTGEEDKTILFYNDAGEIRGKSIYNDQGKRTQQIEYNGKEGYRVRKYHNDELMSETTHVKHDGKLTKTDTYVMPGGADEVKVMTLYYYNPQGDPNQMVEFITETKNAAQKLTKTTHVNYLYVDDIWVAKIEYSTATKNPGKIVATIRTIETPEKTYHAPSTEQLKAFCQEAYQNYLKL